jgi:hypothetical protein
VAMIILMMIHINANTTLGQIILRNINWLQLSTGIRERIFSTKLRIDHVGTTWFHPIKAFLNKIDGHIIIEKAWTPKLSRKDDVNLMEKVLTMNMSKENIHTFNNWSLYYQVINLSDITSMDGTKIKQKFLLKKECKLHKPISKLRWPIQVMPHVSTFHVWKQTIAHISGCKHDFCFKRELRNWFMNSMESIQITTTVTEDYKYLQILQQDQTWQQYQCTHQICSKSYYTKMGNNVKSVDSFIPVDIYETNESYYINQQKISKVKIVNNTDQTHGMDAMTLQQYLQDDRSSMKYLVPRNCIIDEELLKNCQEKMTICSDSGLKNNKGSYRIAVQRSRKTI